MRSDYMFGTFKKYFDSIYETINHYYPTGNLPIDAGTSFSERATIDNLILDNFHDSKIFKERWQNFKVYLKGQLKKPVQKESDDIHVCYTAVVVLKQEKIRNLYISKKIYFHISLLGPYFTIYGIDRSDIFLEEPDSNSWEIGKTNTVRYSADHAITISPHMEYELPFKQLHDSIRTYFPGIRFVPFEIAMVKIPGISEHLPDTTESLRDTVFSAIFKPDVELNTLTRGNKNYGYNEWTKIKRLSPNQMNSVQESLMNHAAINQFETTIHKVWELDEVKPLPSQAGNSMFVKDLIKIMDLTDSSLATLIAQEDEEPAYLKYYILDNELHFESLESNVFFELMQLDADSLTMGLYINNLIEASKAQGSIAEIRFKRY